MRSLIRLLSSEHVMMQNEALVAITTLLASTTGCFRDISLNSFFYSCFVKVPYTSAYSCIPEYFLSPLAE